MDTELNKTTRDHPRLTLDDLHHRIDSALQLWGKRTYPDYSVFQTVVELGLSIAEAKAREWIEEEMGSTGYLRAVTDYDRQQAVWRLLKKAINTLRPPASELPHVINEALDRLPQVDWPEGLCIPQECLDFLVLSLAYVWKLKHNKEIARLLGVSERTLAHIRSKAVGRVALHVYQWELHCTTPQFGAG